MLFRLPNPEILELAGADAAKFAQGQFCNDAAALEKGCWQWNAWLNLQGRVRWFFHLLRVGDQHFLLLLRGGKAAEFAAALKPYILRDKVSINTWTDWQMFGAKTAETLHNLAIHTGATLPSEGKIAEYGEGYTFLMPGSMPRLLWITRPRVSLDVETGQDSTQVNQWRHEDIEAGIVEIDEATSEHFIPQMLGFERLDVISFRKGCYLGQEVVARIHFKGGNKRYLYQVEFDATPFPSGTEIFAIDEPTQPIGHFLNGISIDNNRSCALAVLREGFATNSVRNIQDKPIKLNILNFNHNN